MGTDICRSLGIGGTISRSLHGHCASSTRIISSHVRTLFPSGRCCTGGILSGNIREGKWELNLEDVVDSAGAIVGHDWLEAVEFACKELGNHDGHLVLLLYSLLLDVLDGLVDDPWVEGVDHVHHVLLVGQLRLGELGEVLQHHVLVGHSLEAVPDPLHGELLVVPRS